MRYRYLRDRLEVLNKKKNEDITMDDKMVLDMSRDPITLYQSIGEELVILNETSDKIAVSLSVAKWAILLIFFGMLIKFF